MTIWTELMDFPFELKFVEAGGTRTRALQAGHGEDVVFLHGISGHLEMFSRVVKAYAKDFRVHLIDMVGHGYSDPLTVPMTMQVLSDHVIAYLDANGIEKAHIVGLSLGGWTAGWVAAHHTDRVLSATLIAAAGDPSSLPARDPKFGEWLRESTRAGVLNTDIGLTRKRLEQVIANPADVTDELVDVRYAIYHQPRFIEALDNLLAMTSPEDFMRWALTKEVLSKVTCEMLVVWGVEDTGAESSGKWLTDAVAKSKLVIFEKTGHWAPYERPEAFSKIATAFLRHGLEAVKEGTY